MGQAQDGDRDGTSMQTAPLPGICPYCQSPLKAKTFGNGTTELKCTQPQARGMYIAHSLTFYYKKS
jgi:hypothetical protein